MPNGRFPTLMTLVVIGSLHYLHAAMGHLISMATSFWGHRRQSSIPHAHQPGASRGSGTEGALCDDPEQTTAVKETASHRDVITL